MLRRQMLRGRLLRRRQSSRLRIGGPRAGCRSHVEIEVSVGCDDVAVGRLVERGIDPTTMTIGEIADADAVLPEALLMGVFAPRKTAPPEDLRDLRAVPPKNVKER